MARSLRRSWPMRLICLPWRPRFANLPCWPTSFLLNLGLNDGRSARGSHAASGSTEDHIEMLKIWGRANSINVQKVLWCCGELGLQYDRIDAGNEFGVNKTPQYRALNPNALVPTIEDGDFQLWESNVIVRYLAQKSGHGRLCPANIKTRFDAERWMDWQATVFWPALRPLFIELIRTPPAKRDATGDIESRKPVARCRADPRRPSFRPYLSRRRTPFPWGTFQPRRPFIGGMRWISITPNCPTSTDGTN